MRKYADNLRYYVDVESYLYKEPISKKKRPDVLVQAEDKLIPEAEYYVRIAGVNKKQDSPPLYRIGSCETPMLVNSALYDVLEQLSWQNKPQVNPVRLMSTNNSLATKPGEYYMYRNPFLPDYQESGFPPYVNVGVCPVPMSLQLWDLGNSSFVTTKPFAEKCTADVVYIEGISYFWHKFLYNVNDKNEKPAPICLHTDFIFSLKTVRHMLAVDPDLVFTPVYTTDRKIQDFGQEAEELSKRVGCSDERKIRMYKLRDYCKKWGKYYDTERFDREYPMFY